MPEYLIIRGVPVEIPRALRADGDAAVVAFERAQSAPALEKKPTPDRALTGEER